MSISFSMGFSCGDDFVFTEKEIALISEMQSRETTRQHELLELEFWPVEHPMEPQDEDRPVKCPMPSSSSASSVIHDSRMQDREERIAGGSFQKRGEVAAECINRQGIVDVNIQPPIRAVRKRHHTLTLPNPKDDHLHHHANNNRMQPPTRMPPIQRQAPKKTTVGQMLQDFDKFES